MLISVSPLRAFGCATVHLPPPRISRVLAGNMLAESVLTNGLDWMRGNSVGCFTIIKRSPSQNDQTCPGSWDKASQTMKARRERKPMVWKWLTVELKPIEQLLMPPETAKDEHAWHDFDICAVQIYVPINCSNWLAQDDDS
jgi:hypothetical protein